MTTTRPRRAAAVLLAAALLLAAAPAVAGPSDRAAAEVAVAPSLFDTLAAWLTALWPGSGSREQPEARWQPMAGDIDPNGPPMAQPQHGGELDPNGGPTPQPQHGPEADPAG